MNKISVFIMLIVGAVITLAFLPIIDDQINDVDTPTKIEEVIAVEVSGTPEVVTTTETIVAINYVKVNDVDLTETTEYTFVGGVLTVLATNSNTGDTISVSYTYDSVELDSSVPILRLIPFLIAIVLAVFFVKARQK